MRTITTLFVLACVLLTACNATDIGAPPPPGFDGGTLVGGGSGDGGADGGGNDGGGNNGGNDGGGNDGGGNMGPQTTSHNAGEACINCHVEDGIAEFFGIWTMAGTVFSAGSTPNSNATVNVFNAEDEPILSIATDLSGNFYTGLTINELIPDGQGLVEGVFVEVVTANNTRRMQGIIGRNSANCNSCHNPTSNGALTFN